MSVANVRCDWVNGNQIFRAADGSPILEIDGTTKAVIIHGDLRLPSVPTADQDDEVTVFANSGVLTVSSDGQ